MQVSGGTKDSGAHTRARKQGGASSGHAVAERRKNETCAGQAGQNLGGGQVTRAFPISLKPLADGVMQPNLIRVGAYDGQRRLRADRLRGLDDPLPLETSRKGREHDGSGKLGFCGSRGIRVTHRIPHVHDLRILTQLYLPARHRCHDGVCDGEYAFQLAPLQRRQHDPRQPGGRHPWLVHKSGDADSRSRRTANQTLWKTREASPAVQKRDILHQQKLRTRFPQSLHRGFRTLTEIADHGYAVPAVRPVANQAVRMGGDATGRVGESG